MIKLFDKYKLELFLVIFYSLAFLVGYTSYAQVGIGTTNPEGILDVTSNNDTGLVMPRVSAIENVTDGNGNLPVNGTMVYDISRQSTCFYQNDRWICISIDANGDPVLSDETPLTLCFNNTSTIDYIKSSLTENYEIFGKMVALSEDGNTLAISKDGEDSNATGINGNATNNLAPESGAVYIFVRTGTTWSQQAYIKASNAESSDYFGDSITLSDDGNTLVVSAFREDSNATGVNGDQTDNSATDSSAVYVFVRTGSTWSQQAYIKASNTDSEDYFGDSLALSGDGNTLSIGASFEDSNAIGINGDQTDNSASNSGAVYVFTRTGSTWTQQAYIKASNSGTNDAFGFIVDVSYDGNTLAVGAYNESSDASGINVNQNSNTVPGSGAVYIFLRTGTTWAQEAFIKASNNGTIIDDNFGANLAISSNGNTLVVGAPGEDSNATGIDGNQSDNSVANSGAAYVFVRSGSNVWSQQAYLKASNTGNDDNFGGIIALSNDGNTLAISAPLEESNATGINGDQTNNLEADSGAVYIFKRSGNLWTQQAYVKSTDTGVDPFFPFGDWFGVGLALSGDGNTLAVGAPFEDSSAIGINGDYTDNSISDSGAVYIYNANSN